MKTVSNSEMKIVNVLMKADGYTLGVLKNRVRNFDHLALKRLVANGTVSSDGEVFSANGKSKEIFYLTNKNENYTLESPVCIDLVSMSYPIPEDMKSMAKYSRLSLEMPIGGSYLEDVECINLSKALPALNKYGKSYGSVFDGRKVDGGVRIWRVS